MQLQEVKTNRFARGSLADYLEVIKPRETALLVFIGVVAAFLAGNGSLTLEKGLYIMLTLLAASAGANGLTNYLDREIDSRLERNRRRALPAGRIYPPERALVVTACLSIAGLVMAWYLHPLVFAADLVGTAAAVVYRKRVTCVFPQGMIASCTPVLMGCLAVTPQVGWDTLLLCALIAVWLPSHIWSIMLVHRLDYRQAGINYFPVNSSVKSVTRLLFIFCCLLYAASLGLYWAGNLGVLYLVGANLLGLLAVYAGWRLLKSTHSDDAWKLYKLSAFPYLGLLFICIALDAAWRFYL